jgi:hypothetical protein
MSYDSKIVLLFLVFFVSSAHAKETALSQPVHTFGLLVGSNLPGKNQTPLRFAHQDADRVRQVLSEIGDFDEENTTVLTDPDAETLRQTLDRTAALIAHYHARNEQTRFLFYYSGHARAHALSLGADEVPLEEVRQVLESLPATIKIVILDACQTGAFSRIKGADPAADFSHNSVETLNTTGMAVLASSTASELSQESDLLEGSFFTHHLVVGLRGAADRDQNGQVTLHEAYQYAYNQTLVATAGTAVGEQHVTLETELKGKGEMVLTKPANATARLLFPAELNAELLVNRADDQTILAEAHKAAGLEMGLAFPPDDYEVLVKEKEAVRRCPVTLADNQIVTLNVRHCVVLEKTSVAVKHTEPRDGMSRTSKDKFKWRPILELMAGGLVAYEDDAFLNRLETLEYRHKKSGARIQLYYEALVGVHFNRYLSLGAFYSALDHASKDEYIDYSGDASYGWRAHRFGIKVRGQYPFLQDHLIPFVQFGVGPTVAQGTHTFYQITNNEEGETHWGYALSGGVGLIGMLYRSLGLLFQLEYIYAPTISNLYDEYHNSGGLALVGGARITL